MTDPGATVLSVRGDAHLEIAPDLAVLDCGLDADGTDKASALRAVSDHLDAVIAELVRLGGVTRAAVGQQQPLTWLARSARSYVEYRWDQKNEERVATGRTIAEVALQLEVRNFALMAPLGDALAGHEALHVHRIGWHVDSGNPAWPVVRASAIEAAIAKGRDYAAALGGRLDRIEHVADVGLLTGGDARDFARGFARSGSVQEASSGDDRESPSLDPVPQVLYAAIEARFTASVGGLA